jgi:threonine dehydrogenase-like Zn-dependent dehydrogenase
MASSGRALVVRALVIDRPRAIAHREVPFTPREGDCTIRVLRAGICGTDLQLLEGYAEFTGIPGHEFVGLVEAVARDADTHWRGTRVVGEINVGCGACAQCRAGVEAHCASRSVLGIRGRDGAFAEYVSLPSAKLHAIPDSLADDVAVFVEPTAAACRILEQVQLTDRSQVAVLGDGRMGLLAAQVVKTVTPHVIVFGRHDRKLAVARSLGLAAERADGATSSGFDVVVDVTGRPEGLQRAIDLARPRGSVVMKTTSHGAAPFTAWPAVVNEVTLVGSRCGPFVPAIALLASGAVRVDSLVSAVLPLDDHAQAFALAANAFKVIFTPQAR